LSTWYRHLKLALLTPGELPTANHEMAASFSNGSFTINPSDE
jgi:hypothetical protein